MNGETGGFRTGIVAMICAAALLLLAVAVPCLAAPLTDAETRGKRIYTEGKGTGRITAIFPEAGIRAPGTGFPCVNCHLADGTGQSEGGVRSADVTWFNLTKEAGGPRRTGRTHPAYDARSVRKAITAGVDPAGNTLGSAHPRFEMDDGDLDALVAYLRIMGSEPVPGVTDDAVKVGILYPSSGPLAEASREVRALLSGAFRETNGTGGIFGRRLDLVEVPFDPSPGGGTLAAAMSAVDGERVFCFLANIGVPADGEAARYLASRRVPVFVPLLATPEGGYGSDRYTFHVLASVKDQGRVMVDFLAEALRGTAKRLGILYARDPSGEKGTEGAREQAGKRVLPVAVEIPFTPGSLDTDGAVRRFRGEKVDAVLYFGGPADALSYARRAAEEFPGALFLAPAPMVGDALLSAPEKYRDRIFLAAPLAPPEAGARQTAELLRLRGKYAVGERHRSFQLLAYAGAILFEEGLKRSGRALTREGIVASLGNVWRLPTGVTPPLTYDANRRAGAAGASILRLDPVTGRYVTAAGWREPQ